MTHFTDNWQPRDKIIRKLRICALWALRKQERDERDNPKTHKEISDERRAWLEKWRETEQQVDVTEPDKELP